MLCARRILIAVSLAIALIGVAVILALGYELVKLWIAPDEPELDMADSAGEAR